jgi:hypothetical protein
VALSVRNRDFPPATAHGKLPSPADQFYLSVFIENFKIAISLAPHFIPHSNLDLSGQSHRSADLLDTAITDIKDDHRWDLDSDCGDLVGSVLESVVFF